VHSAWGGPEGRGCVCLPAFGKAVAMLQ